MYGKGSIVFHPAYQRGANLLSEVEDGSHDEQLVAKGRKGERESP